MSELCRIRVDQHFGGLGIPEAIEERLLETGN